MKMKTFFDCNRVTHVHGNYEVKIAKIRLNHLRCHLPQVLSNFIILNMLFEELSIVFVEMDDNFEEQLKNHSRLIANDQFAHLL